MGLSLAFFIASANFFASKSSLFFCASTLYANSESRRASASRKALVASPKSSNVFLRGAGVWEITPRATGSIFRMPPQSGQLTSKGWSLRPIVSPTAHHSKRERRLHVDHDVPRAWICSLLNQPSHKLRGGLSRERFIHRQ